MLFEGVSTLNRTPNLKIGVQIVVQSAFFSVSTPKRTVNLKIGVQIAVQGALGEIKYKYYCYGYGFSDYINKKDEPKLALVRFERGYATPQHLALS